MGSVYSALSSGNLDAGQCELLMRQQLLQGAAQRQQMHPAEEVLISHVNQAHGLVLNRQDPNSFLQSVIAALKKHLVVIIHLIDGEELIVIVRLPDDQVAVGTGTCLAPIMSLKKLKELLLYLSRKHLESLRTAPFRQLSEKRCNLPEERIRLFFSPQKHTGDTDSKSKDIDAEYQRHPLGHIQTQKDPAVLSTKSCGLEHPGPPFMQRQTEREAW